MEGIFVYKGINMEFVERQRLVRRITSGKLYGSVEYKYKQYEVLFKDPNLDISIEADWFYKKFYEEAKDRGGLTLEESYKILEEDDRWNKDMEIELKGIKDDLDKLAGQMEVNKYNKSAQRVIKATIKRGEERYFKLLNIKNQLRFSTIEHMADLSKQTFTVRKIAQVSDPDLLASPSFQEILRVYYFEDNGISESQLRELARTDPWRLYWTSSKDTGTSLFPHSAVEFTDLQYLLVLWTRVYDFAYECQNRPTDDIIDDDTRFDSWYRSEVDKRNREINKASIENEMGGRSGGQEMFIPADEEGAKEVYNLNDFGGRVRIKEREKAIKDKGSVRELDLPDIRRDVQMEMNKMAAKAAK